VSKLRTLTVDPKDPKSVAEAVQQLVRIVSSEISIGDPLDPGSDQSVVLAGGTGTGSHNGRPSNVEGTWVEVEFESLHTTLTCTHNLGVPVINNEVNVRWVVMGIRHSGVGAAGASTLSINYQDGDSVTTNSIALRAYSSFGRTVDATNPIRASLRFYPASRWPN